MRIFILLVAVIFLNNACSKQLETNNKNTLFQVSTIDALLAAVYDSDFSFTELKNYGDFGIGTFNKLDGELILLDSVLYQVKSSGLVKTMPEDTKVPFVTLNFFEPEHKLKLLSANNYDSLKQKILLEIEEKQGLNFPYAIKLEGDFKYLKLRSVPAQSQPYPELKEVVAKQSIFEQKNISGTMIGYWLPGYFKGFNVPGFHFHFISEDKKKGGHVLDFNKLNIRDLSMDELDRFKVLLDADSSEFRLANTTKDRSHELEKVEK